MKRLLLLSAFVIVNELHAQNVGIGTTTPNPKAALEIKSSDKGILFPRLTSAQRNAIANPPNGLHVFNTDERCLNFYDSLFQVWNCYCDADTCKTVTIPIAQGCNVDFYATYASKFPAASKYVVLINPNDTVYGCSGPAFNFTTMPVFVTVKIINRGVIIGHGGLGGNGATGHAGSCIRTASPGNPGGHAIATKTGVTLTVDNYGLIAAGGGGGGGGGGTGAGVYGGGGGAGAGFANASGGTGGGTTFSGPFSNCGTITSIAQYGTGGQTSSPGGGGTGANTGGNGGTGGGWAQQGQTGTGNAPGIGGLPGKAISGGTGNIITNISGGQKFGLVD